MCEVFIHHTPCNGISLQSSIMTLSLSHSFWTKFVLCA